MSGLADRSGSEAVRALEAATRLRRLAACGLFGLVLEVAGWSLLTMPVFVGGEACGTPLASVSSEACRDRLATPGWIGWLFVLAGVGLLVVALREVWQLTEHLRS